MVTNATDFDRQDCPDCGGNDGSVVQESRVGGQQCSWASFQNMAKFVKFNGFDEVIAEVWRILIERNSFQVKISQNFGH